MIWLKYFHVSCVVLSFCGFALRGYWRVRQTQSLRRRWARVLPHVVDSGLFFSGLAMAVVYRWSPLEHPWLLAKLLALLAYIGLGALALRYGRPWQVGAALLVFAYMVAVALTKSPLPLIL